MRQTLEGKIISNKTNGVVTVRISRLKKHPLYGKYVKVSKQYQASTTEKILEGASVVIESSRPLSKNKKWKVIKVL